MAAFKIVLVVLVSMCLAEASVVRRATTSLSQSAMDSSIANIQNLGAKINKAIADGTALLSKYVDNSTDYAATFKVNIATEVTSIITTYNKAIADAQAIVKSSNSSVAACFTAKKDEAKQLALDAVTEIMKCAVTKLMQFKDLLVKLVDYGKQMVTFIPDRIAKVKSCDTALNEFFKLICVNVANTETVIQLATISSGVASTVSTATTMYSGLTTDLTLCAASKLFSFRQTILKLTTTVGSCTAKSIFG